MEPSFMPGIVKLTYFSMVFSLLLIDLSNTLNT